MNSIITTISKRIASLKLHLVLPMGLTVFMSTFSSVNASFQALEYEIVITPDHFPIIFPRYNEQGDPVDYGFSANLTAGELLSANICGASNNCSIEATGAGAVYYTVKTIAGVGEVVFYYTAMGQLIGTQKVSEIAGFDSSLVNQSSTTNPSSSNHYNPVAGLDPSALERAFPTSHESYAVGTSNATFDVGPQGNVSYSVPIFIPPALNGLQPELSIDYSGQNGDGLLGVGFGVSGLSSMTRCGRNSHIDGTVQKVKTVKFTNEDAFCLDGARLILTSGNHAQVGATYQTEINNHSVVTVNAVDAYGPTAFEVKTKSGQTFTYAGGIKLTGHKNGSLNGKKTQLWPVTQIKDIAEQTITFNYELNNDGTTGFRPSTIVYGGASNASHNPVITFNYENNPQARVGYTQGFKLSTPKRLKNINVSIGGIHQVRQYNLSYNMGNTYKSRISQILECSTNEEPVNGVLTPTLKSSCLAPITFDWSDGPDGLKNMGLLASVPLGSGLQGKGKQFKVLDFNQDGHTDVLIGPNENGRWYTVDGRKLTNQGSSVLFPGSQGNLFSAWDDSGEKIRSMGLNGDGKQKLVLGPSDTGWPKGSFYIMSIDASGKLVGTKIYQSLLPDILRENHKSIRPMDVNGDGKQDLLAGPNYDGSGYIMFSNGTSFNGKVNAWNSSLTDNSIWFRGGSSSNSTSQSSLLHSHTHVQDANGDGLSDLLIGPNMQGSWDLLKSTGSSYQIVKNYTSSPTTDIAYVCDESLKCFYGIDRPWASNQIKKNDYRQVRFLDINGDGLNDMLFGPNFDKKWYLKINTGDGFAATQTILTGKYSDWHIYDWRIRVMDVNLDGLADVVLGPSYDGKWYWLRSDGKTLVDEGKMDFNGYASHRDKPDLMHLGDADGDGLLDILLSPTSIYSSNKWYGIKLNAGTPDKITRIKNGVSPETNIHYEYLTKGGNALFTKGTVDTASERSIVAPMHVVQSVTKGNGVGGLNETTYHYEDLRVDLTGRGFKGFRKITKTDTAINTVNETEYMQNFPHTGAVKESKTLVDGVLIERKQNSYAYKTSHGGKIYQPLTTVNNSENYAFNTGLLYKKVTTLMDINDVDAFGNTHKLVTTTSDIDNNWWKEETNSTYEGNGETGRLKTVSATHSSSLVATSVVRESSFDYYPNGQLKSETIEPNASDSTLTKTTTYTYNDYGLKSQAVTVGYSKQGVMTPRSINTLTTIDTTITDHPALKTVVTNDYGEQATSWISLKHGKKVAQQGPNGLMSSASFDLLGREISMTNELGVEKTVQYDWVPATTGLEFALYQVTTQTQGLQDKKTVVKDALNREIHTSSHALDGREIVKQTIYDEKGLVAKANRPYLAYAEPVWLCFEYDALGRLLEQNMPASVNPSNDCGSTGRAVSNTSYDGLITTTTSAPDAQGRRHIKTVEKDAKDKLLHVEEGDNVSGVLATLDYSYDVLGNLIAVNDGQGQVSSITYDANGRKISMIDPTMGTWSYEYNSFDELTKQTDGKNNSTTMQYDQLGRMVQRTDGSSEVWQWTYAQANDADNTPIGKLKRVVGPNSYEKTFAYTPYLQPQSITETQTINGQLKSLTQSFTYDNFGRAKSITSPQGFVVEHEYNRYGYLVAVKSPSIPVSSEITAKLNAIKQAALDKVAEAESLSASYMSQAYSYQQRALEYEIYAQAEIKREAYSNASSSRAQSLYQAANELRDISAVLIGKAEDQRLLALNLANDQSTEAYETHRAAARQQAQIAINQLAHAKAVVQKYKTGTNGVAYTYTETSVLLGHAEDMINNAQSSYNNFQNQQALAERYEQYAAGIAEDVQDSSETTWWRVASADAEGRITESHQGNGTITKRDYDPRTGLLRSIETSDGVTLLQQLRYEYDNLNNVTQREDVLLNYSEYYDYDGLDRLTKATVSADGISSSRDYAYDASGNLQGLGDKNYSYDQVTRRLTNINATALSYDDNGNITTLDEGKSVAYSSFNKPVMLSKGNLSTEFVYDESRSRMLKISKENGNITKTTRYFGAYEQITNQQNEVEHRYSIQAGGTIVAIHKVTVEKPNGENSYVHVDALGSTDIITNSSGVTISRQAYTPFGANRDLTGLNNLNGFISFAISSFSFDSSITNRGYTGHEHIDDLGFIHMNGRVYDPSIGRFLSADPHVQMPSSTQGYNRYAYVQNNPLKYTDPSGYFLKRILKEVNRFVKKYAAQLVSIAIAIYAPWTAIGNGFAAGFVGGLIGSGGDLKAAITGGIFGAVSAGFAEGIGNMKLDNFGASLMHGMSQGLVGVLRGGQFKEGFLSGFAGHYLPTKFKSNLPTGDSGLPLRTAVAAMSGGIASKLGGGKFSNGAVTAAFVHLFNYELSHKSTVELGEIVKIGLDDTGFDMEAIYKNGGLKITYDTDGIGTVKIGERRYLLSDKSNTSLGTKYKNISIRLSVDSSKNIVITGGYSKTVLGFIEWNYSANVTTSVQEFLPRYSPKSSFYAPNVLHQKINRNEQISQGCARLGVRC